MICGSDTSPRQGGHWNWIAGVPAQRQSSNISIAPRSKAHVPLHAWLTLIVCNVVHTTLCVGIEHCSELALVPRPSLVIECLHMQNGEAKPGKFSHVRWCQIDMRVDLRGAVSKHCNPQSLHISVFSQLNSTRCTDTVLSQVPGQNITKRASKFFFGHCPASVCLFVTMSHLHAGDKISQALTLWKLETRLAQTMEWQA